MATEAAARADRLLRGTLAGPLVSELDEKGFFTVLASTGGVYQIRMGRYGNVTRIGEDGTPTDRFCIHPGPDMPDADTVLAQTLLLWTDEERFLKVANRLSLSGFADRVPVGPDPNQQVCATARAFAEEIAQRRAAEHMLNPHDDPFRLYRGFQDTTNGDWVVVSIRLLRVLTDEDAEPLGLTGDEMRGLIRHPTGMYELVGADPSGFRMEIITRSLETPEGRESLAQAVIARIRYGGPVPTDIRHELVLLTESILDRTEGEGSEGIQFLREWIDEDDPAEEQVP